MKDKAHRYEKISKVPNSVWEKLSQKKFYFGHQSVGFNIIDGINDLMKEYPAIKLNIVETGKSDHFDSGIFAHSRVGRNLDTKVKIDDFSKVLDNGVGRLADAATLKFCYLDISKDTDVAKVLGNYSFEINKIKKKYPNLIIIHFTEPLTVSKSSWKTWIKKILRKKEFWEFDDNIKRNQYNEMLIKEYQGHDPILDIAAIESTKPDGTRQKFELHGVTYYSMYPDYTKDGGHLNELGRKRVAEQFLLLLSNLN